MTEPRFPQLDRLAFEGKRSLLRVKARRRTGEDINELGRGWSDPDRFLLDECVDDVLESIEALDSGKP